MKKTADLYVRVSTEEQANSGYSQRHQEEMLRKYCENNDIHIRKVIYEDHSAKTFERPAWQKMLQEYKRRKGLIDVILVLKWDRFSRSASDSYAMLNTLSKLQIEVQAIEQPLDLSVPESKIMLAMYLSMPEVENLRRGLNVLQGMRRARKEGRYMGGAPKGYANKVSENGNKYIAPKYPDAEIIRWVFEQIAQGGYAVVDLWRAARQKGLVCSKPQFYNVIQNPVYCGKIVVPQFKNEEAYTVQGKHEPIVSEELFYTVQDIIYGRKKPVRLNTAVREEFPLRNFLICPNCSRLITASRSKGCTRSYNYYHCVASCGWRYRAEFINEAFVNELKKYRPSLEMLEVYKKVILDVYSQQHVGSRDEKKQLLQQINDINSRLTKARELLLADTLDAADYKAIKAECERKIQLLEAKISAVPSPREDIETLVGNALYNLAHIDERYQKADTNKRRQIISSIYPKKLQFLNGTYRTTQINEAVELICALDKDFRQDKKRLTSKIANQSYQVAPTRIELVSKV